MSYELSAFNSSLLNVIYISELLIFWLRVSIFPGTNKDYTLNTNPKKHFTRFLGSLVRWRRG